MIPGHGLLNIHCTTPVAVFTTLLRLKNAHLKKLSDGETIYFERLLGDIFGSLEQPLLIDRHRQHFVARAKLLAVRRHDGSRHFVE